MNLIIKTIKGEYKVVEVNNSYELYIPHNGGFLKTYESDNISHIAHYLSLSTVSCSGDNEDIFILSSKYKNILLDWTCSDTDKNKHFIGSETIDTKDNNFYYALPYDLRTKLDHISINAVFMAYGYDEKTLLIEVPMSKIEYIKSKHNLAKENICAWVCSLDVSNRQNLLNYLTK